MVKFLDTRIVNYSSEEMKYNNIRKAPYSFACFSIHICIYAQCSPLFEYVPHRLYVNRFSEGKYEKQNKKEKKLCVESFRNVTEYEKQPKLNSRTIGYERWKTRDTHDYSMVSRLTVICFPVM